MQDYRSYLDPPQLTVPTTFSRLRMRLALADVISFGLRLRKIHLDQYMSFTLSPNQFDERTIS